MTNKSTTIHTLLTIFPHFLPPISLQAFANKLVKSQGVIGVFILTGIDRKIEAFALDHLPERVVTWSTAI